jgi:hypothetical protein
MTFSKCCKSNGCRISKAGNKCFVAIFLVFFKVFEVHDHLLNSMIKILNIKTSSVRFFFSI